MVSIQDKVRAGMEFLDEKKPGWESRIDIERLNLANPMQCVLGQLYGEYTVGIVELDLIGVVDRDLLGFTIYPSPSVGWSGLTCEWKESIVARRLRI